MLEPEEPALLEVWAVLEEPEVRAEFERLLEQAELEVKGSRTPVTVKRVVDLFVEVF